MARKRTMTASGVSRGRSQPASSRWWRMESATGFLMLAPKAQDALTIGRASQRFDRRVGGYGLALCSTAASTLAA